MCLCVHEKCLDSNQSRTLRYGAWQCPVYSLCAPMCSYARLLRVVLEKLRAHGLAVSKKKAQLCLGEVHLLGFVVDQHGLRADPSKTRDVQRWAIARNVQEVQRFVGFANYFRTLIPKFAHVMAPLYAVAKKAAKSTKSSSFEWTIEAQQAFDKMKDTLCSLPKLRPPDFRRPFVLMTDASDRALGAVLGQLVPSTADDVKTKSVCPLMFHSRVFTSSQLRWHALEQELFAIVDSVRAFEAFVSHTRTIVFTDHANIVSLVRRMIRAPVSRNRVARWVVLLGAFEMEFRYVKGGLNVVADALSRSPVCNVVVAASVEELQKARGASAEVWQWQQAEPDQFVVVDGVMRRRFRHYQRAAWAFLKTKTWRPDEKKQTDEYVRSCHSCQLRTRPIRGERHGALQPVVSSEVFEIVGIDFCGPFPKTSRGNSMVCTLLDHFSGFVQFVPAKDETEASAVAALGGAVT